MEVTVMVTSCLPDGLFSFLAVVKSTTNVWGFGWWLIWFFFFIYVGYVFLLQLLSYNCVTKFSVHMVEACLCVENLTEWQHFLLPLPCCKVLLLLQYSLILELLDKSILSILGDILIHSRFHIFHFFSVW